MADSPSFLYLFIQSLSCVICQSHFCVSICCFCAPKISRENGTKMVRYIEWKHSILNNSHLIPEQPVLYFHKGENPMRPVFIDWNNIPDTISKDQFCKICHMSKKNATKYLGTVIPCSDNGKKTHRYTINKTDLISFLERTSERQQISTITPVVRCSKTACSNLPLSEQVTSSMHEYYEQLLHLSG